MLSDLLQIGFLAFAGLCGLSLLLGVITWLSGKAWAYVVLGIILLIGLTLSVRSFQITLSRGIQTTGELVEITTAYRGARVYHIAFRDQSNMLWTFTTGHFGLPYSVGDRLTIAYLPSNPKGAVVVRPLFPDDAVLVCTIALLYGASICFIVWGLLRLRRSPHLHKLRFK